MWSIVKLVIFSIICLVLSGVLCMFIIAKMHGNNNYYEFCVDFCVTEQNNIELCSVIIDSSIGSVYTIFDNVRLIIQGQEERYEDLSSTSW